MQIPRQALRRAAVISPLAMFVLFAFASGQNKQHNPDKEAIIHPSNKLITVMLTMPDGRTATISQYDGEMLTADFEGEALGIVPHTLDNGTVVLYFSRIVRTIKKNIVVGEKISNIGDLEVSDSLPRSTPTTLISTVQVVRTSEEVVAESKRVIPYALSDCPCCVTCGSERFCGVEVNASCGNCACP